MELDLINLNKLRAKAVEAKLALEDSKSKSLLAVVDKVNLIVDEFWDEIFLGALRLEEKDPRNVHTIESDYYAPQRLAFYVQQSGVEIRLHEHSLVKIVGKWHCNKNNSPYFLKEDDVLHLVQFVNDCIEHAKYEKISDRFKTELKQILE